MAVVSTIDCRDCRYRNKMQVRVSLGRLHRYILNISPSQQAPLLAKVVIVLTGTWVCPSLHHRPLRPCLHVLYAMSENERISPCHVCITPFVKCVSRNCIIYNPRKQTTNSSPMPPPFGLVLLTTYLQRSTHQVLLVVVPCVVPFAIPTISFFLAFIPNQTQM